MVNRLMLQRNEKLFAVPCPRGKTSRKDERTENLILPLASKKELKRDDDGLEIKSFL